MFSRLSNIIKKTVLIALTFSSLHLSYASSLKEEVLPVQQNKPLPFLPQEVFKNMGTISHLPRELLAEIISYCESSTLLPVNRSFFTIITGYKAEDILKKGFKTHPSYKNFPWKISQALFGILE